MAPRAAGANPTASRVADPCHDGPMLRNAALALSVCVTASGCYLSHPSRAAPPRADAGPPSFDARPPSVDAGPRIDAFVPTPDGGGSCPSACTEHVVGWTQSGGFVAEQIHYELSPCGRVFRRIDRFDAMPETCVIHIESGPVCDVPAAVNALIATDAVSTLREEAPVVVGVDDRPVDGVIFEVTIDGDVIGVGHDCDGASGCRPVPMELRSLESALTSLEALFFRPDVCPGVHPATFACGRADGATISCLTGREVCYLDDYGTLPSCQIPGPMRSECDGPTSCDCLIYNAFVESCREPAPGEVTIEHTGP